MRKKTWDLYAPIYERAMRADQNIYTFMYERIPHVIRGMDVLEIAAGPGPVRDLFPGDGGAHHADVRHM